MAHINDRGRDPTGIFEYEDDTAAQSIALPDRHFHNIANVDGSVAYVTPHHTPSVNKVEFRTVTSGTEEAATNIREVTFVGAFDDPDTELPSGSKISLVGQDATLIMAYDNERFFDAGSDGYQDLLVEASVAMEKLSQTEGFAWVEPYPEMNWLGWLWRWMMLRAVLFTMDGVNRLRLTRFLQNTLAFMFGYESFALGGVIRAFDVDDRSHDLYNLRLSFQNRNASRALVQALRARWDWAWHTGTSVSNSRFFDIFGLLPFIGITSFPATENFPSTKNHVINGWFSMFFSGSFFTRAITGNQEGIVVFNKQTAAQNLAAEVNRFEASNRNQYGTLIGREKTVDFRLTHRLAIDESIVRSFQNTPATVIINNGVEHVIRCLAKHWRNMLYQDNGNFAHQRMEQLNPFETLRFFMPIVLSTLANLRGRNVWDIQVLGPFIKRLQVLNPDKIKRSGKDAEKADEVYAAEIFGPCQAALAITEELKEKIIPNVCGGVPSRMEPFGRWADAIRDSIVELNREAEDVKSFVATVDIGIKLGYQLLKLVNWRVPQEKVLRSAIVEFILNKRSNNSMVPDEAITLALQKLPPKDERTLKELIVQKLGHLEAAVLLLDRTGVLLERELRRRALDERIRKFSRGTVVSVDQLERNKWYWVEDAEFGSRVYVYKRLYGNNQLKMVDVEYNLERLIENGSEVSIRKYIPVAEAISRAQKVFMTVEIDHGKKFSYNAFMEFGSTSSSNSLRTRLRRLLTLAQVHCSELDKARLNVLSEIKGSVQRMRQTAKFAASRLVPECKPQNLTVFGGGPTGLMGAIHCLQNVILSGGEVRIFEGRDAFDQEAAAFERAQIVRLDARQISMLRYHLGTGYEDVFIPAKGETDSHVGNTLASQAFVEVTIKRMEIMILDEIINLRSKGLLEYYTDSKVKYNALDTIFEKQGRTMKLGDRFIKDSEVVEVCDYIFPSRVPQEALVEGKDYDIVLPREKKTRSYRLVTKRQDYDWYLFSCNERGFKDVSGSFANLPPIYMKGEGRLDPSTIVVETTKGTKMDISFDEIKDKSFVMDFSGTHVMAAIGKPEGSPTHIYFTTKEPYAVCCIEGIKVSMGMHNFGIPRWGRGITDDLRSHSDQNTRIIGDFTKSVNAIPICDRMYKKMKNDQVWIVHFDQLAKSVNDDLPSLSSKMLDKLKVLCATKTYRERLQTRFFELGNNYYLGMEFTREYDKWKREAIASLAPSLPDTAPDAGKASRKALQGALNNRIDRLWYESCLEIIHEGDVYNPGGKGQIPQLYLIPSPFEQKLGELKELETFRLFPRSYRVLSHDGNGVTQIQNEFDTSGFGLSSETYVVEKSSKLKKSLKELVANDVFEPVDTFEVVCKRKGSSVVRNSRGYITILSNDVHIGRESDLSRAPNGYSESKVAMASFPVAHVVSHRTVHVNRVSGKAGDDGYVTAYVGDAQASPHFMRYSGLTGACINCMSFNNMIALALQGVPFEYRVQRYAFETNWSNGEVVQRGTGANYGDGFLRPGFTYRELVNYLYARVCEHRDMNADTDAILTRDWKIKVAASIVPRGLEMDSLFYESLLEELHVVLWQKYQDEVKRAMHVSSLSSAVSEEISFEMDIIAGRKSASLSTDSDGTVKEIGKLIGSVLIALKQSIDYSVELRLDNARLPSELYNQSTPIDSIVDDFAVEAQNFANALTTSAALTAAVVALGEDRAGLIGSALLGTWNIFVSFGTMTNVSRYKNRNEEARRKICDNKYNRLLKAVFSLLTRDQRDQFSGKGENPFIESLDHYANYFIERARYYDKPESDIASFENAYNAFKNSSRDQTSTISFMHQLVTVFIAGTFHESSYLQEYLVNLYKELNNTLDLVRQSPTNGLAGAVEVYRKLLEFRPALEASIQRGDIKYGFLRSTKWYQSALPVSLRVVLSPIIGKTTIGGKTWDALKAVESLRQSDSRVERTLSRPIRDLTELYHATKESEASSTILLASYITFWLSVAFTIIRIIEISGPRSGPPDDRTSDLDWIETLLDIARWASLGTLLGAVIAVFHFARKLRHLFGLGAALSSRRKDPRIRTAITVLRTQQFITIVRFLSVLGSSAAMGLWIALQTDDFGLNYSIIGYVALGAIGAAIASGLLFIVIEFLVRYNLDPRLGRVVCEPFRDEIEQIKSTYSKSGQVLELEATQAVDKEIWEYTAREFVHKYRFDTVFAADRFGTIVQHIHSGNKMD